MDINDIRGWFTVIMIVMFVLIWAWAWSHKRVKDFKEAANLPLTEPEHPRPITTQHNNKGGDQ